MKQTASEASLRKWAAEGMTAKEIARRIGRHPSAVTATLNVLGISRSREDKSATRTAKQRAHEWRDRYNRGETMTQIAASAGYSVPTVSRTLAPLLAAYVRRVESPLPAAAGLAPGHAARGFFF